VSPSADALQLSAKPGSIRLGSSGAVLSSESQELIMNSSEFTSPI
jgi:hypothetical protein